MNSPWFRFTHPFSNVQYFSLKLLPNGSYSLSPLATFCSTSRTPVGVIKPPIALRLSTSAYSPRFSPSAPTQRCAESRRNSSNVQIEAERRESGSVQR